MTFKKIDDNQNTNTAEKKELNTKVSAKKGLSLKTGVKAGGRNVVAVCG